jgi:nucleoside-specific outer membrane channel protein Tsx
MTSRRDRNKILSKKANCLILAIALLLPLGFASKSIAGSSTFQTSNIEYLYGNGYKLGDKTRSTITFENFNCWKYGDNFFFVDITNAERDGDQTPTSLYGEFSPRLSLSKISHRSLSFAFVKDVLLAGTLEMGEGFHNYLYGIGFDLDVPKFSFVQLNFYVRNNPEQSGQTYQITPCWYLPFTIGPARFIFEGFADIAGSEGDLSFNVDTQPRLLLDLGNFWGAPNCLYVGTEYMYWHNKFGVKGVDESLPQAMVKWVF